jgi:Cdc25 family phosphatase
VGEGEWVDEEGEEGPRGTQRVYVLERGFEGWQEAFGRDARLTENWSEELWGAE